MTPLLQLRASARSCAFVAGTAFRARPPAEEYPKRLLSLCSTAEASCGERADSEVRRSSSGHQELLFDQGAERVGSRSVAARPPDDPFSLGAGNGVPSSKVADVIGLISSHPPAVASVRSVIRHGNFSSWLSHEFVLAKP